jgi:5-methylcytosine-specific restriction endonuclease McrA
MAEKIKADNLILSLDLVPSSCWFSNVRSHVTKAQWDHIRKQVYSEAWYVCEICGGEGKNHPVEAHEVWNYNDKNHIQKLERMIALCPNCHSVKHFGLSTIRGIEDKAIKHFMVINKINKKKATKHIDEVFDLWRQRSQFKWNLDISILSNYGIDVKKLLALK